MIGKQETGDRTAGLAAIVPQLFYDVIARIIPGSILAVVFFLAVRGPRTGLAELKGTVLMLLSSGYSSLALLAAGSVTAYGLSILLWQQFALVAFVERKIKKDPGFTTTNVVRSFKYDFIKHRDAAAGSRITKLSAEIHMTETFFMGFVDVILLVMALCAGSAYLPGGLGACAARLWLIPVVLVPLAGSFLARVYFRDRADHAVRNCYEIHEGPATLRNGTVMYGE